MRWQHHYRSLDLGRRVALRALYAYIVDEPPEACPRLAMPLHTLLRLTPTAYGCEERRMELGPPK